LLLTIEVEMSEESDIEDLEEDLEVSELEEMDDKHEDLNNLEQLM